MPKKNKEDNENTQNIVSVSLGSDTLKDKLSGKTISINLKKTTYFGVGKSRIWLSPENYWAVIPSDLTDEDYKIIDNSIVLGNLILGKKFIPPVDKASNTLEQYWLLIKDKGFELKEAKTKFTNLVRRGQDSGWTAIEIAKFCLDKENSFKKRKNVISVLTQLITQYRGPIQLYDPPDEEEGIKKVTIKADGSMEAETNSGKKVAKRIEAKPPNDYKPGSKSSAETVNDLFS